MDEYSRPEQCKTSATESGSSVGNPEFLKPRARLDAVSNTANAIQPQDGDDIQVRPPASLTSVTAEPSAPKLRRRSTSLDESIVLSAGDPSCQSQGLSPIQNDHHQVRSGQDCPGSGSKASVPEVDPSTYRQKANRQLTRSKSQIQNMRSLSIPGDSSFRRIARQLSGRTKYEVDHASPVHQGNRPKNFFDLAIVTMCCFFSVLGLIAVLMSVLSDANFKAGHLQKSRRYSKLALAFSITGIVSSVILAITLLLVFRYPWSETEPF